MTRLPVIPALAVLVPSVCIASTGVPERVRLNCVSEASMLCSGVRDVVGCLKEQKSSLTSECKDALEGKAPAPLVEKKAAQERSHSAAAPVAFNSIPVQVDGQYSGPGEKFLSPLREFINAETPNALQTVASKLDLPQYASGLSHPLSVRFFYDPTAQDGLGNVTETPSGDDWAQSIMVDIAAWEDCPSKDFLRSLYTHEMTHATLHDHLLDQAGAIPFWFDEGLAVYVSGDPDFRTRLQSALYRHGTSYPEALSCNLDSVGGQTISPAIVNECYPYFGLAVRAIAEASPKALPNVIADLRNGDSLADAVQKETRMNWQAFKERTDELTRSTLDKMSIIDRLKGRWWHLLECRG